MLRRGSGRRLMAGLVSRILSRILSRVWSRSGGSGLSLFASRGLGSGRRAAGRCARAYIRLPMEVRRTFARVTCRRFRVVITARRQQRQSKQASSASVTVPHQSLL
jgi:hypothetical protein